MISFIIPTLNEASVLEETLQQLQTLTTLPYEIIISDGKSQDETISIAKRYTKHVVIYTGKTRQTIALARNMGAEIAIGDFLVFLDADVHIPTPNAFFFEALQCFKQDPKLVAVTVAVRVEPPSEMLADKVLFGLLNLTNRLNNNFLGKGSASGEFQLIKRSAFEQVRGFNAGLVAYEDFELFQRLSRIGRTRMLRKLSVFHTGRRAHKVGHARLLLTWILNGVWYTLFHKARTKEWEVIR